VVAWSGLYGVGAVRLIYALSNDVLQPLFLYMLLKICIGFFVYFPFSNENN